MIYKIYSIKDELTGFNTPTFEQSDAVAKRNFGLAVNSYELFKKNTNNFSLFCLGEFDTELGTMTSSVVDDDKVNICPYKICDAASVLEKED